MRDYVTDAVVGVMLKFEKSKYAFEEIWYYGYDILINLSGLYVTDLNSLYKLRGLQPSLKSDFIWILFNISASSFEAWEEILKCWNIPELLNDLIEETRKCKCMLKQEYYSKGKIINLIVLS